MQWNLKWVIHERFSRSLSLLLLIMLVLCCIVRVMEEWTSYIWWESIPSTLSEQDVPMPVSPLSEAPLWRLPRLLVPGAEEVPCHDDSHPGTHPGGLVLEPKKQDPQSRKKHLLETLTVYYTVLVCFSTNKGQANFNFYQSCVFIIDSNELAYHPW